VCSTAEQHHVPTPSMLTCTHSMQLVLAGAGWACKPLQSAPNQFDGNTCCKWLGCVIHQDVQHVACYGCKHTAHLHAACSTVLVLLVDSTHADTRIVRLGAGMRRMCGASRRSRPR
jgi:hypothetical protein